MAYAHPPCRAPPSPSRPTRPTASELTELVLPSVKARRAAFAEMSRVWKRGDVPGNPLSLPGYGVYVTPSGHYAHVGHQGSRGPPSAMGSPPAAESPVSMGVSAAEGEEFDDPFRFSIDAGAGGIGDMSGK